MLLSTLEQAPGKQIAHVLGMVSGSVVTTRHLGKDLAASVKTIVGGEIRGYTEMLDDARKIAMQRLEQNAADMGADAVLGIRFTTSSVMQSAAEVTAYGTAVLLR